jgi:hypothetical protein
MNHEPIDKSNKIERLIEIATEVSVEHLESEVKSLGEKRKLTLWIAGLATALEVYVLNRFSSNLPVGFYSFLYYTAGVVFLHNALTALTTYRMTTNLVDLHLKQQDRYRHQRLLLLTAIDRDNAFTQTIIQDYGTAALAQKIRDLDYFNGKKVLGSTYAKLGKRLVHYSDRSASFFLTMQVVSSLILLIG